jgi:hypothetical protein
MWEQWQRELSKLIVRRLVVLTVLTFFDSWFSTLLVCLPHDTRSRVELGTRHRIANSILVLRYLLNSTMLKSCKYGSDGSLTIYVQKDSPGGQGVQIVACAGWPVLRDLTGLHAGA